MNSLTKIDNNEVVTDSRDLEDVFGTAHRSIYRLITKHADKLGKVRFENTPTESGQIQKYAILNERQAILLLTYTRSNEKTDLYRQKLVDDFLKMREYIRHHEALRLAGVEIRKTLTDAVQGSGEVERMHGHAYSTYTRLAYSLIGIFPDYTEFKKTAGKDATIKYRDTLDGPILERLKAAENLIKSMLNLGKEYAEIKSTLTPIFERKKIKE